MHDLLARGNGLPAVCYKIKLKEKKQMKRHLKTAAAGILMFGALGATAQVQALPLLIDNFTMFPDVNDKGGDAFVWRVGFSIGFRGEYKRVAVAPVRNPHL